MRAGMVGIVHGGPTLTFHATPSRLRFFPSRALQVRCFSSSGIFTFISNYHYNSKLFNQILYIFLYLFGSVYLVLEVNYSRLRIY